MTQLRQSPDQPTTADVLFQAALAAAQGRDLRRAAELFGRVIELEPRHAAAHGNRATVLMELEQWDAALASFDRAVALKPDYAVAWSNRGNVLQRLRRDAEALASYDRALAIAPRFAEAWSNRGSVLRRHSRLEEALASYDAALLHNPLLVDAYANRGIVLSALGSWAAALANYDQALALAPDHVQVLCNRGTVLQDMRHLDAALASYERALALDPLQAEAHFNRALTLLTRGELAAGWLEHEWRRRMPGQESLRFAEAPWLGKEPLTGATLLLHAEQGLGDTLQFCRYAPLLAQRGVNVVLEVPAVLRTLLAAMPGVTVLARGEPLPPYDRHCPLMSLPLAFGTTLDSIPSSVPYLACDAHAARAWRERLGAPRAALRVGLVWAGGLRNEQPETWAVNARRNLPLAKLAVLAQPGVEFHSLQKGEPAESELARLAAHAWSGAAPVAHGASLRDFADTAALIENLDLVISVDTSTAHLAGALGKPVWILNRFDACWRWLDGRSDSPWYPTARLFRQTSPGDWDEVLHRVALELAALVTTRAHTA